MDHYRKIYMFFVKDEKKGRKKTSKKLKEFRSSELIGTFAPSSPPIGTWEGVGGINYRKRYHRKIACKTRIVLSEATKIGRCN